MTVVIPATIKARLNGRHTSVSSRAAAWSGAPDLQSMVTTGMAGFLPMARRLVPQRRAVDGAHLVTLVAVVDNDRCRSCGFGGPGDIKFF
jgi:hypothetical protein